MIRQWFKTNAGILFHSCTFKQVGLDPASLYPHVTNRLALVYGNVPQPDPDPHRGLANAAVIQCDPKVHSSVRDEEDLVDRLSAPYTTSFELHHAGGC